MYLKDDTDFARPQPGNVRKGRFLWMADEQRRQYIDTLKEKIAAGYYFSDGVLSDVVSALAPVMEESLPPDTGSAPCW